VYKANSLSKLARLVDQSARESHVWEARVIGGVGNGFLIVPQ